MSDNNTEERDLGWSKIWAALKDPIDLEVDVGWFEEAEATKAAVHDLGMDDAPETAFVRQGFDDNLAQNEQQLQRLMGKVVDGDLRIGAVGLALGRGQQSQLKRATARAGLVETGAMRDAVAFRYRIDGKGKGEA